MPVQVPANRVVAYVDILGFSELLERMRSQDIEQYTKILAVLQESFEVRDPQPLQDHLEESDFRLEVTSFSDCSVISSRFTAGLEANAAYQVAKCAGSLAKSLMRHGFFCRGGIAIGAMYHKNRIAFGPGMLDAFLLESKSANYPRIIVEDRIADLLESQFLRDATPGLALRIDRDGLCYINLFKMIALEEENQESKSMIAVGTIIQEKLKTAMEEANYKNIARWRWCVSQFNRMVNEMNLQTETLTMRGQ